VSVERKGETAGRAAREAEHPVGPALWLAAGYGSAEEFWRAVQENIKSRLGLERYSLWFGQTELMEGAPGRLVVGVPNVVIQQFLTARYRDAVAAAARELLGREVQVVFDVAPRLFRRMRERTESELSRADESMAPLVRVRGGGQAPPATLDFDRLIMTRRNRLPFAAARELAGQENPRLRFLYIWGDYGLGKTALMRAMHSLASGSELGLEPIYASVEQWCNGYYHAIQSKTTRAFRSRYRATRLLLLDDVQFIEGKHAGQIELVHNVKQVLSQGGRVALAGVRHPAELRELDPELQALLRRAFPAALAPPEPDEREAIVRELCARAGLSATGEVLRFLGERYGEGFGRMNSAVSCLAVYAGLAGGGTLDLPAAQQALASIQPPTGRRVGIEAIKQVVTDAFPVRPEELVGRSRSRTVCLARHVGMYLAHRLTGASLTEIGRSFGGFSHSAVRHAVKKIAAECRDGGRLAALVGQLLRRLGGPDRLEA